ncbi:hypothetical protein MKK63_10880 [Methylobacterium sp. J-088]|uniref:hypothetical protein n=1 Tax=Methylobacterium sp. J-088 TaxID=2836664 RepID=UPI001FBA1BB1|nr:hypothetical protein [Methylobacterium sp. J-088]MCJ2063214.1 hypothetical protein [Methylobacterium sp. J-088]
MAALLSADSLPSALGIGLQPWIAAIETVTAGLGEHASAVAANASTGIRRRIVPTPLLDHALVQARLATDALAVAVDEQRVDATRLRADAMAALGELIMWLQEAKANSVTEELGLGW